MKRYAALFSSCHGCFALYRRAQNTLLKAFPSKKTYFHITKN